MLLETNWKASRNHSCHNEAHPLPLSYYLSRYLASEIILSEKHNKKPSVCIHITKSIQMHSKAFAVLITIMLSA